MKNNKIPVTTYLHLAGFALFIVTSVLGYVIEKSPASFALLGGYVIFLILSALQNGMIGGGEAQGAGNFGYNFALLVKSAIILCMFLIPGTFGNIHSDEAVDVARAVLLFACAVFVIVNYYAEKIRLMRAVSSFGGAMLNSDMPPFIARTEQYFALVYTTLIIATIIVYALARGAIGPLWLICGAAVYAAFSVAGFSMLLGKNGLGRDVCFAAVSLLKFVIPFILYVIYGRHVDPSLESTVFLTAYRVLVYVDVAALCIGLAADIFAAYFAFIGLINGKKRTADG